MTKSIEKPRAGSSGPVIVWFALTLLVVVGGSLALRSLNATPEEKLPDLSSLQFTADTTVAQVVKQVSGVVGEEDNLPQKLVTKSLDIRLPDAAQSTISEVGLTPAQARSAIGRTIALRAEHESKDFKRILLKFGLWLTLLIVPLVALTRRRLTPRLRLIMLAAAVAIFGVVLGSDPSPMGTVKDAIVLFGAHGAVFPPRLIALAVFLLIVVFANKFICSWGCQFGTLQEFIYRLNRRDSTPTGRLPLLRLPFALTNTIRVVFFAALTVAAFAWAFDLVGVIDPFRVFKPAALGWLGGGFVALILVAALFIYRPWCNLLCPFGLVSWLAERLSFYRVRVDYNKCIACRACARACPSESMQGILTKQALPADCFACGDCLAACPTEAVRFTRPGQVPACAKEADVLARIKAGR